MGFVRMKVVIVGGGAGGISTASNIRKLDKDIEITVITRDNKVAYSPCAIPYVLSVTIESFDDIDMRTPEDYKESTKPRVKDISVAVSSSLHIDAYAYLQVVNIETDEDIFGLGTSNNIRRGKYLKYDQSQMLYSPGKLNLTNPNASLISFTVSLSEQELTETRTYPN
jgi:NADPH-dependent 2,4-dienoyl-CoA reductase/sulfur reductase-like enzyme